MAGLAVFGYMQTFERAVRPSIFARVGASWAIDKTVTFTA